MAITLRIDNFDQLPDGGPIEFTAGARGFDIGRGQHLDWCLPDETRFISTTHCEVRYDNGNYWLNDVSKNGTSVNGAEGRINGPHRLANGDRLKIGPYYVAVSVTGGAEAPAPVGQNFQRNDMPSNDGDIWGAGGGAAPAPADRRWFANEQKRGQRAPDVLEHFVDLPAVRQAPQSPFGGDVGAPMRNMPGTQFPGSSQQFAPPANPTQWPGQGGGAPAYPAPGAAPAYAPPGAAPGYPPPAGGMPMPQGYGGPGQEMSATAFINALAASAGISPQAFAGRAPDDVAAELGAILRTVTEQLAALLRARAAAKQMTKSGNRTMITAQNNNPLKFVPDVKEALEVMFARNRTGYLTAAASFKEGFDDIKSHEIATYSAMQKALARVMEDLSPDRIEDSIGTSAFGSKKGRAWELFVERWNAKTEPYEHGILGLFLNYFAEAYDSSNKK